MFLSLYSFVFVLGSLFLALCSWLFVLGSFPTADHDCFISPYLPVRSLYPDDGFTGDSTSLRISKPVDLYTAAFRFVTLNLGNMDTAGLVKAGVAFNINGFIITPFMSILLIIVMSVVFFSLCVSRFSKADFSRVKIFKHSH